MSNKDDIGIFNKIRRFIRHADAATALALLSDVDSKCSDACVIFEAELRLIENSSMQGLLSNREKIALTVDLCQKIYDRATLEFAVTRVKNHTT